MENKAKKVIGIYIRVSTKMQVEDGFSLEAQKREGTDTAYKTFGKDIEIKYFIDEGKSAKSTKSRHDLLRMMSAATFIVGHRASGVGGATHLPSPSLPLAAKKATSDGGV